MGSDLFRKTLLQIAKTRHVLFLASAHDDELDIEFQKKGRQSLQKNIKTLLLGQPRNHSDHKVLLPLRKTELFLQSSLVDDSMVYRMEIVGFGNERVVFGIEVLVVQPV